MFKVINALRNQVFPYESTVGEKPAELPDLSRKILVYCRSGRCSADAVSKLAKMGHENIYDFRGIIDWTGLFMCLTIGLSR